MSRLDVGADGNAEPTERGHSLELGCELDRFHEWILNLPWVVERPYPLDTPGVRSFAVDCEPLGRRQMWLITGLLRPFPAGQSGIAVILPFAAADMVETAGWGRCGELMPGGHVLVTACGATSEQSPEVEALALCAYSCAMS